MFVRSRPRLFPSSKILFYGIELVLRNPKFLSWYDLFFNFSMVIPKFWWWIFYFINSNQAIFQQATPKSCSHPQKNLHGFWVLKFNDWYRERMAILFEQDVELYPCSIALCLSELWFHTFRQGVGYKGFKHITVQFINLEKLSSASPLGHLSAYCSCCWWHSNFAVRQVYLWFLVNNVVQSGMQSRTWLG